MDNVASSSLLVFLTGVGVRCGRRGCGWCGDDKERKLCGDVYLSRSGTGGYQACSSPGEQNNLTRPVSCFALGKRKHNDDIRRKLDGHACKHNINNKTCTAFCYRENFDLVCERTVWGARGDCSCEPAPQLHKEKISALSEISRKERLS